MMREPSSRTIAPFQETLSGRSSTPPSNSRGQYRRSEPGPCFKLISGICRMVRYIPEGTSTSGRMAIIETCRDRSVFVLPLKTGTLTKN
jgi:hypothetical protein